MSSESLSREQRLQEILAAYLQEVEGDKNPDREQLLAQHPELADDLRSFLVQHDQMRCLVAQQDAPTVGPALLVEASAVGAKVRYFGDYELLEEIARGGMGVVYKARQVSLNRIVALKMILAGQLATPADVQRFRAEAEAAAHLDHPNIVPIYEVGEHEGQHFFSMKLVERGSPAATGSKTEQSGASKEAQSTVARLVAKVAHAVHHAHQRGILHRDLKPANILLDAAGEPHITDFGLAKRVEGESGMTQSGAIVGTPSYMAPEQARAEKRLTTSIDVYSLGAILYELLTHRPPFQAATPLDTLLKVLEREPMPPRSLSPGIDRDLETICLKCLHKEPERRYESAAALADDLTRWLHGEPIVARATGPLERVLKWAKRRPVVTGLLAVVVVLVAVGFPLVTWKWQEALHNEQQATAQLRRAETALYTNRVGRAYALWKDNDRARAQTLLEECPAELRGWEWNYVHRLCDDSLLTMKPEKDITISSVYGVAFSPDGKLVAETSKRQAVGPNHERWGEVHVWDIRTGREAVRLQGFNKSLFYGVAFSPDGKWLASAGQESEKVMTQRASVWDVSTGREVYTIPGRNDWVGWFKAVTFSPDGRYLAVSGLRNSLQSANHQILLCDARTGKLLHTLEGGGPSLSFSPDGRLLASIDGDINTNLGSISIWESNTGKKCTPVSPKLNTRTYHTEKNLRGVAFSPDGQRLVTWGVSFVRVWNAATGVEQVTLAGQDAFCGAWSPDGRRLALGFGDGTIKFFDADSGRGLFALRGESDHLAFSPDGSLLVSGSGRVVRLWDVTRGQEVQMFQADSPQIGHHRIDGCALSPDGKLVGYAHRIGKEPRFDTAPRAVKVTSMETRRDLLALTELGNFPGFPYLVKMAFCPEGKRFAVVTADQQRSNKVRHWDLATGREGTALESADEIEDVIFSPDGNTLALVSFSKLALHNLTDGRERFTIAGEFPMPAMVPRLAFSRDGSLTAVVGTLPRNEVRLLETASGNVVRPLKWRDSLTDGSDGSLAFSADGRRILLCSYMEHRGHILVWDVASGQLLHAHERLKGMRGRAAFSPDGSRLATVHFTPRAVEIALWDTATGQEVFVFKSPTRYALSTLQALTWSADGSTLIIADQCGDVRFWNATPRSPAVQEARRAVWDAYALDWHHRAAREAEREGHSFGAAFHLARFSKRLK